MKALLTYLLLTLTIVGARAERAPLVLEIPRQVVGNIAFYVIPEKKQIWLELPYHLKGSIISADDTHMLSIFAQTDTNLERQEIASIRSKYPGYKLREAVVLASDSVVIDLGINKKITLAEDPSGKGAFFSAEVLLTTTEAQALKAKIKAQQLPVLNLTVRRSVPYERIFESVELPTRRICDELVQASGNQPVRFARGLSILFATVTPEFKKIRTAGLVDQAMSLVVDTCLTAEKNSETKVGQISVSFSSKNTNFTDLLKMSAIEEVPAVLNAVVESEWSIL
jgi:hypothetical protein